MVWSDGSKITANAAFGPRTRQLGTGMCGTKKCPMIIYRLKKYRDTGIPRYFVTSSIVDNFRKNPTVQIICCALSDFKLSASGRRCHVAGIYFEFFMYADDLLLISSTRSDLHTTTTTTTTVLQPFFQGHPGEPVPEKNFWTLWCKGRLTEADTQNILLGATPSRLTSAHLQHPPIFFTGRMPFLPPNQQRQSTAGAPESTESLK